jgi:DNA polymerase-3 subunit epsilon
MPRPTRSGPIPPLDAVIGHFGAPATRLVPAASSLSERAAQHLEGGPCDPLTLMRVVCQLERLRPESAARMAEVLLGGREAFVQLDDDRWALLREGRVVQAPTRPREDAADAGAPDTVPFTKGAPHAAVTSGRADGGNVASARGRTGTPLETSLSLETARFAVVDVETTGSQPGLWDRVTEIAIVPVDGFVVGAPWSQLVHPGRPIPPMISALTGISDAMVASAPAFAEIADEVAARLEGRIFTAHNAPFDRRFVDAELTRTRALRVEGAALCTVRLTRKLVPALSRRSLDRVTAYFGVRIDGRHRAGGDALATAQVLVRLLEIARERHITTWPALLGELSPAVHRRLGRPSALPHPVREDHTA